MTVTRVLSVQREILGSHTNRGGTVVAVRPRHRNEAPMQNDRTPTCACGCGNRVSRRRDGTPRRWVHGHNGRTAWEDKYVVVDRGYATPCWEWTLARGRMGHGRIKWGNRFVSAPRAALLRAGVEIPDGWHVDHLCRNPPCVNPDHLEPVTPAENTRRGDAAKLTADDVAAIRAARAAALAADPFTAAGTPRRRVRGGLALREELAARFGVRADYIKEIWRGDKWAA